MNGAKNTPQTVGTEYYLVTYTCNVTRRDYTQKVYKSLLVSTASDAVRKCKADNDGSTMVVKSVTWIREVPCTGWSN